MKMIALHSGPIYEGYNSFCQLDWQSLGIALQVGTLCTSGFQSSFSQVQFLF
jgi:hypothetical protein